eukprot:TRINITY_DN4903_c0_g1_i1.p1 TRINITY_DN4903_c0_g1~~TRINITY_DN4903_c0_g1_i1.p1  ORF type:complete len:576 (+),score=114.95 TRINITY_DN4903_c0_g1_i1:117-1844(+)
MSWYQAARPAHAPGAAQTSDHEAWWWSCGDLVKHQQQEGQKVSYYSIARSKESRRRTENGSKLNGVHDLQSSSAEPCRDALPLSSTTEQRGCAHPARSAASSRSHPRFLFVSSVKLHDPPAPDSPMPPMSTDGGSQEEFEEYWDYNDLRPRQVGGGWMEYRAHPQVKNEPYWFHPPSGMLTFTRPAEASGKDVAFVEEPDGLEALDGEGPVWEMSVKELKGALQQGLGDDLGLDPEQLAKRAVYEYEKFMPKVLSWHDYQYLTFWFFGGMDKQDKGKGKGKDGDGNAKSFFNADRGATRMMFASDAFFNAAAKLLVRRMHRMHPINLTYFVWTFSRAGVVLPDFMRFVGDHMLSKGQIPMCDRCSLGTMVWNFSQCGIRHDRYFEETAAECVRPNRLRSLAPRNFQNTMIAFCRRKHWHEKYVDAMARGIPRLLDAHDPRFPKTDTSVLFSYTCRDGSEVPADAFRISSLTVILKQAQGLRAGAPDQPPQLRANWERCCASMADYVRRSVARSPPFMREQGDASEFFLQLGRVAEDGLLDVRGLLPRGPELQSLVEDAPTGKGELLRQIVLSSSK